jgi:hypothetical protein
MRAPDYSKSHYCVTSTDAVEIDLALVLRTPRRAPGLSRAASSDLGQQFRHGVHLGLLALRDVLGKRDRIRIFT